MAASKRGSGGVDLDNRSCRDLFFLIFFLAFWVGMFIVAGIAGTEGDYNRLLYPLDGYGEQVRSSVRATARARERSLALRERVDAFTPPSPRVRALTHTTPPPSRPADRRVPSAVPLAVRRGRPRSQCALV